MAYDEKLASRTVRTVLLTTVALTCLICDQVTKHLASNHLADGIQVSRLWGMVQLQYMENSGGFLGAGAHLDPRLRFAAFVLLVSVTLLLVCLYALRGSGIGRAELLAAALIVGGGLGNLADRLRFGSVRDFLLLELGGLHTGVFNAADLAITCGTLIFFASVFRRILFGRRRPTVLRTWFEK
jgi:signal peptidase II